jgi:hypothetical protein
VVSAADPLRSLISVSSTRVTGIALLVNMYMTFVPHRKDVWASTACYGDGCNFLYVHDVRISQEIRL